MNPCDFTDKCLCAVCRDHGLSEMPDNSKYDDITLEEVINDMHEQYFGGLYGNAV